MQVEKTTALQRKKTGGRKAGVPNKPRSVLPNPDLSPAPRAHAHAPAHEASPFPPYRLVPTSDLVPYANNARTHTAAQIDKITASMREFGFTNPVLTDGRRGIVAGHGRVLAALKLGLAMVPTIELSHLSDAQRRAYVLADNRLALDAGWDDELLRLELGELRDDGFDLLLTGFDGAELQVLFAAENGGLTDPDEAPPVEAVAVSVLGDVWLLGRHRLVCGDSTDADAVDAALAGAKPHLMVTDPPYGVGYDADWRNHTASLKLTAPGAFGAGGRAIGKVANDGRVDWREAWALFPGHVAYVWHSGLHVGEVAASLVACKYAIRAQIVWVKTRPVVGRGDYHWQHEPVVYAVAEDSPDDHWRFESEHEVADYAVRAGSTGHWQGSRKQSTVWMIEHIKSETGHSTQKPVECMRRPMENNSAPGDAVYEPFSGSGTTIIAGEMTGRVVLAIELSPVYVDVAVRRWQAFTGAAATLGGDGRSFDDVAAERLAPPVPVARKRRAA